MTLAMTLLPYKLGHCHTYYWLFHWLSLWLLYKQRMNFEIDYCIGSAFCYYIVYTISYSTINGYNVTLAKSLPSTIVLGVPLAILLMLLSVTLGMVLIVTLVMVLTMALGIAININLCDVEGHLYRLYIGGTFSLFKCSPILFYWYWCGFWTSLCQYKCNTIWSCIPLL